uniref:receptor protein serine/threonine kinase n=1 Tax=Dracunculus medinensis TaxID=318479 RepID=A0A0N4UMY7_DRAME
LNTVVIFSSSFSDLDVPVDFAVHRICNCSQPHCDSEFKKFLGISGLCRSKSGTCFKRLLSDNTVVFACLEDDSLPELFCATRQPAYDGSVMACCQNVSFCNGNLHLELPLQVHKPVFTKLFIALCVTVVVLFFVIGVISSLFLIKGPLKNYMNRWRSRNHDLEVATQGTSTEELLLSPTSVNLGHLGNLLCNLDDSFTTGSGSGLPLLVQRTIARQIELQNEIGRGRFGEVWLGSWKGDPVAVKIFSSRDERSWNREVEIFQTNLLRHPNILRFIASDNKGIALGKILNTGTSTQLWLITEYHEFGSLYDYLTENTISVVVMLQMIRSIANGLSFLHTEIPGMHSNRKPAIAHRDLKTKNVLVKNDFTCVIADLGLSVRYINGEINLPDNNKCGTIRYLSPEILEDSYRITHFDSYKMSDVYSFGLIIWEIVMRCALHPQHFQLPYWDCVGRDPSIEEMRYWVCEKKHRPKILDFWRVDKMLNDISRMMQECWAHVPSSRLTAMNVRNTIDKIASTLGYKIRV